MRDTYGVPGVSCLPSGDSLMTSFFCHLTSVGDQVDLVGEWVIRLIKLVNGVLFDPVGDPALIPWRSLPSRLDGSDISATASQSDPKLMLLYAAGPRRCRSLALHMGLQQRYPQACSAV